MIVLIFYVRQIAFLCKPDATWDGCDVLPCMRGGGMRWTFLKLATRRPSRWHRTAAQLRTINNANGSARRPLVLSKEGDAYAQVADFVRARFVSVARNPRNIVGTVRGQPISLVLGGKRWRDPVVLLCDLGAMPERRILPWRLLRSEPLLSSASRCPRARSSAFAARISVSSTATFVFPDR
jgi:hypothetical protein